MQNLDNITLEDTRYGRIYFLDRINLTAAGSILDIDRYVNIFYRRIELDSSALPNFNTTANLSFYDLNFTNPRILKDGVVCSECVIEGYSSGVLRFRVPHFTVYTVEETPSGESGNINLGSSDSGGGGGGGGSSGGGGGGSIIPSRTAGNVTGSNITGSLEGDIGETPGETETKTEPEIKKEVQRGAFILVTVMLIVLIAITAIIIYLIVKRKS